MKRQKWLCVLIAASIGAGLMGSSSFAQGKLSLTISSGPIGGDWYSMGGAIGEMIKETFPGAIVTVTTGGALENISKIHAQKADIGFTMAKLYYEALRGIGAYEGKGKQEEIRAVAFLANIPMSFFLVKEDNPLKSIDEIKARKIPLRILTSRKGSSPALAAELMLEEHGFSFEDIKKWGGSVGYVSYAEASTLIKDGHADAYIGPMVSAIVELTTLTTMKMLPIKEEVLDRLQQKHQYVKIRLPKQIHYFVKEDTPHMAEAVILVVRKGLDDDVVYKLVKAIAEQPDRIRRIHQTYKDFDPKTAWKDLGGPMHPGAEKFYREKGYMK